MNSDPLLNNKINSIIELYSSGQISDALESIEILIGQNPNESILYNISGVCLKANGKLEMAAQSFKSAINLKPDFADAHYNLALTHQELNHLDDAVKSYQETLAIQSDYAKAHNNLGIIYNELGQNNDAIKSYKEALSLQPDFVDALNNLGNIQTELGKLDEAIKSYNQALDIEPNHIEVHNNLGNILNDLGQLDEAVKHYEKAIAIYPDYGEAHNNLGSTLNELGEMDKAVKHCERAIAINPYFAEAHNNLGTALKAFGKLDEAIKSYMNAITINPNFADVFFNLGILYYDLGQPEEALNYYRKALSINPDFAAVYENLGLILQEMGQSDEAFNSYVYALALEPHNANFHRNLSTLKNFKEGDTQLIQIQSLLSSSSISKSERINLCFALAKAYEDLGKKDEFFKILNEGNKLRKEELNYSIESDLKKHTKLKNIFKLAIKESSSYKPLAVRPIFIVGMPRSGTSLVEQIISSHNKVKGAGELPTLDNLITPIFNAYLSNNNILSERSFLNIRKGYTQYHLSNINSSESIITDKMPTNFENIGFILKAFPEAKIIHLKRDSMAICWSIYQRYFPNGALGFPYSMSDLALFYLSYEELMAFWHDAFPNQIYDISYENLTTNQEVETRNLLDYCELDWDENCLKFYNNAKATKTASALQVKEKMYQGSSEAWKKYEAYLKPLINSIGYYQEKL